MRVFFDQGTSGQGVLGATQEKARQMPSGGGAPHIMHFFLPVGHSVGGAGCLHCQPQVLVSTSQDFVGRVPNVQSRELGPISASVQSASFAQLVTGTTHAPVFSADLPFLRPSHALRYVTPSQPQTGAFTVVQRVGLRAQVPCASARPQIAASENLQYSFTPQVLPARPPQALPVRASSVSPATSPLLSSSSAPGALAHAAENTEAVARITAKAENRDTKEFMWVAVPRVCRKSSKKLLPYIVTFAFAFAFACSPKSVSIQFDSGADAEPLCTGLKQLGAPIEIVLSTSLAARVDLEPSEAVAQPAGLYVLTSLTVYAAGSASSGGTGVILQQTLEFQGSTLRIVQTESTGESRSSGTFVIENRVLRRTDLCSSVVASGERQPVLNAAIQLGEQQLTMTTTQSDDAGTRTSVSTYARYVAPDR
jgi:hypothetical protein